MPHRRSDPFSRQEETRSQKVSLDWAFMRDRPGDPLLNVLVVIEHTTGTKSSIVCENLLSNNPRTIREVLRAFGRLGHRGAITLQSDGEPALQLLLENVGAQRDVPTLVCRSPAHDS